LADKKVDDDNRDKPTAEKIKNEAGNPKDNTIVIENLNKREIEHHQAKD
jgi:hypothetical protein